ncbi:MAG: OsmC family protein [Solirubrobacterales bacterium]|nr:OsmC family protein [Solirubrobacterales bacterium]
MDPARLIHRDQFVATVDDGAGHTVTFDEPVSHGGTDTAPSPTGILASALTACTILTLKMYADRKGWDIEGVGVEVDTEWDGPRPSGYRVRLEFPEHLDEDQVKRLKVIAGKCPVHRTLANPIPVAVD